VLDGDGERRATGGARSIAAHPVDVQREIIGCESESHHFRGKRELIAAGEQVPPSGSAQNGLSLFAEAQVYYIRRRRDAALLHHGSHPLCTQLPWPRHLGCKQSPSHSRFPINFLGVIGMHSSGDYRFVRKPVSGHAVVRTESRLDHGVDRARQRVPDPNRHADGRRLRDSARPFPVHFKACHSGKSNKGSSAVHRYILMVASIAALSVAGCASTEQQQSTGPRAEKVYTTGSHIPTREGSSSADVRSVDNREATDEIARRSGVIVPGKGGGGM
jgi:hypothetical protein